MRARLAAPLALVALVILFFWKLVLTNQYTWMESPDIANLILPWFQFQAGEWHHGRFPLWDPYGWGGQPLFGQAQPGAAYPLNWLLFLLPLNHGWIAQLSLHWYYVLVRILAALTMFKLCRDLGRSRAAAIIAGLLFALGGYVANTDWPQMVNGAVWAPLALMYLFRAQRGERPLRSAILSGFFLGFMWLAGHHQMQLYISGTVGVLWLWFIFVSNRIEPARSPNWPLAKLAALSILIAVMTSAFQTIPTAEYGRISRRWSGTDEPLRFNEVVPYNVHKQYALSPQSLIGVFIPGLAKNADPFIGIVAVALVLLGLALAWRDARIRWLAAVALFGLLFALGPLNPIHGILYALVPLFEKARVPAAGIVLFSLAAPVIAAFGVDYLEVDSLWRKRILRGLAVFGVVTLFACLLFAATHVPVWISDDRLIVTAVYALLAAAVWFGLANKNLSRTAALCALGALVFFDLSNEAGFWWPNVNDKDRTSYIKPMSQHSDLVQYVRSRPGLPRVEVDSSVIPYNIGPWYGIETFESYVASVPQDLWRHDVFSERFRQFMGIQYLFAAKPSRPNQRELYTGRSGLKVFENPDTFPRAWAVHDVSEVKTEDEAKGLMQNPTFDLHTKAFLLNETPPQLAACPPNSPADDVEIDAHQPNRVRIKAKLACRGMVLLADTYFRGWQATVDGNSTPIYQADSVIRGVAVDAGTHLIEMRYRPRSVILGGILTLLAAALSCYVFFKL
ncbi:MAG: YfhO family protein [Bryobacteraceae bacterium]